MIREAGGEVATLRVGAPGSTDFEEMTLPTSDWLRIAEAITDLSRHEPPPSWFASGSDDR